VRAELGRGGPRAARALACGVLLVALGAAPFAGSTAAPAAVPTAAPTAVAVSAGSQYTCAVTSAGGAECWGYNQDAELGDNSTTNSSIPVPVTDLSFGVSEIAAGGTHACALADSAVECWGYNGYGELGIGTIGGDALMPALVNDLSALAISAGLNHTCAITSARGVDCWGNDGDGELGNGSTTNSGVPVAVSGLSSGVVAIASGDSHNCALTNAGEVECWGQNINGQLGNGATAASQTTPVDVSGLSGVVAIAAGGQHTCALTSAGAVECWGANNVGQLGDGTTTRRLTPVAVSGLSSGVIAIAAGEDHSCALTSGGAVECWGYDSDGQLGDGATSNSTTPVAVSGLSRGVLAIAAGGAHTCAVTAVGGIDCWGVGGFGQLGDATTTDRWLPSIVLGFGPGAAALAVGYDHTCAVTSGERVDCWGLNGDGQLGNGTTNGSSAPVAVLGLGVGAVAVVAGEFHSCVLTTIGEVECWGANGSDQLGYGTGDSSTPVAVTNLSSGVVGIAAGDNHTCALTSAGAVECWGSNEYGQLGDNSTTNSSTPVSVSGLSSGVVAIAAGEGHSCALTSAGKVECWGYNAFGQLGNGSVTDSHTPVDVTGLSSGVVGIAAGEDHTCALTSGGKAECWGDGSFGQLGNGTTSPSTTPSPVSTLSSGAVAIAAGGEHTCALNSASALECWGDNSGGDLGDGTTTEQTTPVAVPALSSGEAVIAAGGYHTCAVDDFEGVECWGDNAYGQLGDGTTTESLSPVEVTGFESPRTLSVDTTGRGSGTITSSPGGIDCGSSCARLFAYGSSVTLNASAAAGSLFTGWSGGGCSGTGSCTVSLSSDQTVTATFIQPRTLTVARAGTGTGTVASSPSGISCGAVCSTTVDVGTSVTLTATAATGSRFAGWSGACAGSGSCSVTLDNGTAVTATFSLLPEKLRIARKGNGRGTVRSTPPGIRCGKTCSHSYGYGSKVSLKANAAKGSSFVGWSGACKGKKTCRIRMLKTRTATASFGKDCLVPDLKGKTLKIARRTARAHDCSLGKIEHASSASGRVVSQKPRPGKRLAHGYKLRLVVGNGRH